MVKWRCSSCKKQIPNKSEPIPDPCVCRDYREQSAREGWKMHPITFEAYIIKRKEFLEKKRNKEDST